MKLLRYLLVTTSLLLIFPKLVTAQVDMSGLAFGGGLARYNSCVDSNLNRSEHAIDSSTDNAGCVFQLPKADTITQACWTNGFVTGLMPNYRVSLQTLASGGGNSGTILAGGSASAVFTGGTYAGDGASQCITLGASASIARGDPFTNIMDYSSGTIGAGNNLTLYTGLVGADSAGFTALPYGYTTNSGSTSKLGAGRMPICFVKSASATYGYPGTDIEVTAYSSNSTPDEYAFTWTYPATTCDTYTVRGIRCLVRRGAAGKTLDVDLYSGTSSLQKLDNLATNFSSGVGAAGERVYQDFIFQDVTLDELDCGSEYAIGFSLNSETSVNFGVGVLDVQNAAELSALPGGTALYLKTRTDAGAWTSVADKRPLCELILETITPAAGGGVTMESLLNRGLN